MSIEVSGFINVNVMYKNNIFKNLNLYLTSIERKLYLVVNGYMFFVMLMIIYVEF